MATRRRRSTPRPVEVTPEPTHEEMLEVASEREEKQELDEAASIEALMSAALADTFEALLASEEEKGIEDFFDPTYYENKVTRVPVVLPSVAPDTPAPKPARLSREPRYLIRQNRHPKYNQG